MSDRTVKVIFNDSTSSLFLNDYKNLTFDTFQESVQKTISKKLTVVINKICYVDDEDDVVTIKTTPELQDALELSIELAFMVDGVVAKEELEEGELVPKGWLEIFQLLGLEVFYPMFLTFVSPSLPPLLKDVGFLTALYEALNSENVGQEIIKRVKSSCVNGQHPLVVFQDLYNEGLLYALVEPLYESSKDLQELFPELLKLLKPVAEESDATGSSTDAGTCGDGFAGNPYLANLLASLPSHGSTGAGAGAGGLSGNPYLANLLGRMSSSSCASESSSPLKSVEERERERNDRALAEALEKSMNDFMESNSKDF